MTRAGTAVPDSGRGMPAALLGAVCIVTGLALNEWTVARFLGLHRGLEPPALRASVWLFQLLAVCAGVMLARHRHRLRRAYLLAIPIPILGLLAGAEAVTRYALSRTTRSLMRVASPDLGWQTAANVRITYSDPAFGPVRFSTGPYGFRRFGDTGSAKIRLLFIGDSYTEASQVSDGEAYYDVIARALPQAEIFAHGTGGYGTLQEYMILDRHLDQLRPHVIIWQFSANDLVNNDHYLETRSPLSSRMRRPYYEAGRIEYRFSGSTAVSRYSRLVRFVDARLAMLRGHGFEPAALDRERAGDSLALARAIGTTSDVMRRVTRRAANVPVIAFASEGDRFSDSVFAELSLVNGWSYVPGVIDSVAAGKQSGLTVDGLPRDGHWNSTGHRIAGRVLARHVKSVVDRGSMRSGPQSP